MARYACAGTYMSGGLEPYKNPYYIQQMRQAAADRDLKDKIDCLQDAIINNRSTRIERVFNELKSTLMTLPQYQHSFKDENGNISDSQLRQAIIEIYNTRARESNQPSFREAISDSQRSNLGTGYWNAIVPFFRDKSQTEVTKIIHNGEFDHSSGDKAEQIAGSALGVATLGTIGACALKGSVGGPWGFAIGAIVGIGFALTNYLSK